MHLKNFTSYMGGLKSTNRLLTLAVIVLTAISVLNYVQLTRALNHQRVILIPPGGLTRAAEIRGDRLDEAYLMTMARYVTGLAFSYSPGSARRQFEELLLLFSSEAYPEAKVTFYNLAEKVVETRVSSVFWPEKISADPEGCRIEVAGQRKYFVDDRRVDEAVKAYLIEYRVVNGRFFITSLSEVEKNKPQKTQPAEPKK